MAKKKQDEEVDEYNVFRCTTCADQPEFEGNAIKEHLQQVHGIEGEPKGTRRMTMHVDGRTFFRSTQEWTLEGGVTLVQFTQHRRIAVLRPLAPPANPRNPRRRTRHNAIARMTKRGRQHPVRSHTMITLSLHDETHIALRNCYAERDAIKALAGRPWASNAFGRVERFPNVAVAARFGI